MCRQRFRVGKNTQMNRSKTRRDLKKAIMRFHRYIPRHLLGQPVAWTIGLTHGQSDLRMDGYSVRVKTMNTHQKKTRQKMFV